MSESDPRPVNSPASIEPHQLPAIPQPAPGALGMPLPAAPWIDTADKNEGFNFAGFLHSLRRRWLSGLGIGFLIASIVAALLLFLIPEKYEAFVIIRVYRDQEQMLRDKYQRGVNPQEYEIEKQTQAALLKSQPVITEALRQPGISQMSIVRDEPWPWMGERDNPVAWLQRELKVRYAEGSEILELSMRERNDEELIRLLNAVTDAYKREVVDKEKINQANKLERLRAKYRLLQEDYKGELKKMGELAKTYGSTQSENVKLQLDMKVKKLMSLENERISARKALNEAADMYQQQNVRMQAAATFKPRKHEIEDMLLQYPEYRVMKEQLIELERR